MEWVITEFKDSDWDDLVEFWKLCNIWHDDREDTPESIKATLKYGGKLFLIITKVDNSLIGSSWLSNDGRRIHIHHFAIHPDYRNRKIGTALAKHTLKFAKDLKIQVRLDVAKDNLPAQKLYRKLGFYIWSDYDILTLRDIQNFDIDNG